MPELTLKESRRTLADGSEIVVEIALEGFIDAANYMKFEKALEKAAESGVRYCVLDFREAHYINSSGIGAIIAKNELYRGRGGALCLAGVSRPVGLSMHLLGVTNLVVFCRSVEEARSYVEDLRQGKVSLDDKGRIELAKAVTGRRVVLREPEQKGQRRGRVLVIMPAENRFTRILARRFAKLDGGYHLLHDAADAIERFEELRPDLVVIDERCDPGGEFVDRMKIRKERSLTSVVKLYGRQVDVKRSVDFKIWENDYLVDPFEVLEFFSLTEAELRRVPKDRDVFHQQVRFEFRSQPVHIEKAHRLSQRIIQAAIRQEEDATALFAAVKEGIDNAVVHGNRSSHDLTVDINFLVDQQKVTVLVEDEGEGFDFNDYLSRVSGKDAFEEARKRILEDGRRGGLGILLMSRCADRIHYSGPGNILRLEKNVK